MEPVTIVVGGIALVVTALVRLFVSKYSEVKRKNEEIESLQRSLQQYATSYSFENCDQPIINSVRNYLAAELGIGGIEAKFTGMDMKQRKLYLKNITHEIAQRMGIRVDNINFCNLDEYTYGQASHSKGQYVVDLNEAMLVADPTNLIKTVCHELRHIQQFQSLENDKWGFSDQRKALWLLDFNDYVSQTIADSQVQYIAYRLQAVEKDADNFAKAVIPV